MVHRAFFREQEPGTHGDPGGAVGEGRNEATAVEVATGGDDRHWDLVHHLWQEQRGRHHARVPTALGTLDDHGVDPELDDLLGMTKGPDGRNAQDPSVFETAD